MSKQKSLNCWDSTHPPNTHFGSDAREDLCGLGQGDF